MRRYFLVSVNTEKMTAEIDLMKNATYIVKNGKIEVVPAPQGGFGKQIISWQGGKPCHGSVEASFRF